MIIDRYIQLFELYNKQKGIEHTLSDYWLRKFQLEHLVSGRYHTFELDLDNPPTAEEFSVLVRKSADVYNEGYKILPSRQAEWDQIRKESPEYFI